MKKIITLQLLLLFLIINGMQGQTWTCGDTLVDTRDGKKYTTVQIGSACWMKQNLNYGTTITSNTSTTTHYDMTNNSVAEKYAPNGDPSKLPAYGALYEWDELMQYVTTAGSQGLCPNGWHIPTDGEWQNMLVAAGVNSVTGVGANKLKQVGEGFATGAGTDLSGFSAKAAGDRDAFGIFYGLTYRFIFWTSSQSNPGSAYHYTIWAEKDTIEHLNTQKMTGLSCRCVKNAATGINKNPEIDLFHLYPNPSQGKVVVGINRSFTNGQITVFNMLGQELFSVSLTSGVNEIVIPDLAVGIYHVNVTVDNVKSEKKLIITR